MPTADTHAAIDGVCAWPNLQQLPDGTIIASIFNQPCHGQWEGDLDCWASTDGGDTWSFRGRPAAHEPGANRMNCAAGFANNGDMLVLCSGWDVRLPADHPDFRRDANILRAIVARSSDGARSWDVSGACPDGPDGKMYIPFGDVTTGDDGHLRVTVYARTEGRRRAAFMLVSSDDGCTWGDPVVMNPAGSETQAIHLGEGRWLAVSREEWPAGVVLLGSEDDGKSWETRMPLTLPAQHNGHIIQLADGRIVLANGNRCWNNYGVDARVSEDQGVAWGPPMRIGDSEFRDCGYPYTVQREDGELVTAWYAKISKGFHYEMRVTVWNPDKTSASAWQEYSGPGGKTPDA